MNQEQKSEKEVSVRDKKPRLLLKMLLTDCECTAVAAAATQKMIKKKKRMKLNEQNSKSNISVYIIFFSMNVLYAFFSLDLQIISQHLHIMSFR